jgi:hypothetical protein
MTAPRTISLARICAVRSNEGGCYLVYIDPVSFGDGGPFSPDWVPFSPTKAAEIVALLVETYGPGILPPATEPA